MTVPASNLFRRIVWPLAVAETIVWAAMFYSFPALLLEWERDLGWSKAELSGAFTLALTGSALLAPVAGRLIDRGFGLQVYTGSAVLGAISLALLSSVSMLWQFYAIWILIGVAMSGTLYEACFAFLTKVMGDQARQAITLVTLVGGFAGTVAFPGTHALMSIMSWRGTVLVLSLTVISVAVPLIWFGCRAAKRREEHGYHHVGHSTADVFRVFRQTTFWLLSIAFAMIALDHGLLITHLLPLLDERGVGRDTAVLAASMIGPMQVAGRLAMMASERHVSTLLIAAACYMAMATAAMSLLGAGIVPMLLVTFVVFQGAGYGVTSIVRPIVIAELLGRMNFGLVAGLLAVPFLAATAASPTVAALIWEIGGYNLVIWVAIAASVIGLLSLLWAARLSKPESKKESTST